MTEVEKEELAKYIYFGSIDILGWPNGQPTWDSMVEAAKAGDAEYKFKVAQIRSMAEYAAHYFEKKEVKEK